MGLEEQLVSYLGGIVNPLDPILKAFYSDKDGVPNLTITQSSDYNQGSLCNELKLARDWRAQLTLYYDISEAPGSYLDFLAGRLGVGRFVGETDVNFYSRVLATLNGNKLTPFALRNILLIFSPNLVIIQEGTTGSGYLNRSFFGNIILGQAGYNNSLVAQRTEPVVAITQTGPNFDTFNVADPSGFSVDDEIWHYGTTTRMYSIEQIIGNDIIIDTRGYVANVLTPDILQIDNSSLGSIRRFQNSVITPAYFGSYSSGVLIIKATIEANAVTNDPVIAKFLVQLMKQAKVPGSKVIIIKV